MLRRKFFKVASLLMGACCVPGSLLAAPNRVLRVAKGVTITSRDTAIDCNGRVSIVTTGYAHKNSLPAYYDNGFLMFPSPIDLPHGMGRAMQIWNYNDATKMQSFVLTDVEIAK